MERREFEESGLKFRFPEGKLFKPDAINGKGMQGVKGCDFVWRKGDADLVVVEVKRSAPAGGADLRDYSGRPT
ncbi:MAG: hypothetical protein U5L11_03545 [Arhodomonas sp.]|nr:hypothetical protein [Arhodomonas sp.]